MGKWRRAKIWAIIQCTTRFTLFLSDHGGCPFQWQPGSVMKWFLDHLPYFLRDWSWFTLFTLCRLLLPQSGSTQSGLEVPSWLLSPPSSRCGLANQSMMRQGPPLFTGSASKVRTDCLGISLRLLCYHSWNIKTYKPYFSVWGSFIPLGCVSECKVLFTPYF